MVHHTQPAARFHVLKEGPCLLLAWVQPLKLVQAGMIRNGQVLQGPLDGPSRRMLEGWRFWGQRAYQVVVLVEQLSTYFAPDPEAGWADLVGRVNSAS